MSTDIQNRIQKNYKKIKNYLSDAQTNAFRLYSKDIPDYPYLVDIYSDWAVITNKSKVQLEKDANKPNEIAEILVELGFIKKGQFVYKERKVDKGSSRYGKNDDKPIYLTVQEGKAEFGINLNTYIDVGLFLDHRPLRKRIYKESANKNVLNLFSYTGSISVMAALAGAKVTSVDLSKTYLQWSKENFQINKIDEKKHQFINQETFEFLKNCQSKYDIIILDPPTYSKSKKFIGDFDVQRDHAKMIDLCMDKLTENGVLYFSNNLTTFKIDELAYSVQDITGKTIPPDIMTKNVHHCFRIIKGSIKDT